MLDLDRRDDDRAAPREGSAFLKAFGWTAGILAALTLVPLLLCLGIPIATAVLTRVNAQLEAQIEARDAGR